MDTPIQRAIKAAGSQGKLADKLNVTRQRVVQLAAGGRVTAEMAVAIEHAVDGAVTRAELRPDLFGDAT